MADLDRDGCEDDEAEAKAHDDVLGLHTRAGVDDGDSTVVAIHVNSSNVEGNGTI